MISYEDFQKIELRTAKVLSAERVEGSEKLLCLKLDAGDKTEDGSPVKRQIVAGIGKRYTPEQMLNRSIIIVANLEPRTLMGLESQGMLLAANDDQGPVVLMPEHEVAAGVEIR